MTEQPNAGRTGSNTGGVLWFIAAMIGALICFIGAAAEASALGRPHKTAGSVLAVVAIAFLVGSIVLLRVAIHLEHGLRSSAPSAAARPVARRPVKNGPVARSIGIVVLVGVFVVLVVATVQGHSNAVRSSDTQHHGLSRTGRVVSVHTEQHSTRYDSWQTYDYTVTLSQPVGTASQSVVHDPSRDVQQFDPGDTVTLLVDPHRTDYAELPGHRATASADWIAPLIFAVLFVAVAVLIVVEATRHRRQRRSGDHITSY